MLSPTVKSSRREPWNKGKLVGQKTPLKLKDIWAIRVRLEMYDRKRELALFNLAIDSKLRGCDLVQRECAMSPTVSASLLGRSSCNRRPSGRCSSKSRSRRANPYTPGFGMRPSRPRTICSRVGCDSPPICRHGNTHESSKRGSPKSAWTPAPMVPTRCAARKHR